MLVDLVLRHLKSLDLLRYSPATIRTRKLALSKFLRFMGKDAGFDALSKTTLTKYQVYLYEETNKQGRLNATVSQNGDLKAAKMFLRFLFLEDLTPVDFGQYTRYAKTPQRLPRCVLTKAEMSLLLGAPDLSVAIEYRDRCLLELLYVTGIRRAECAAVCLNDLNLDDGLLMVRLGKGQGGGKDRVVPLGRLCVRYLRHYVSTVRGGLLKDRHEQRLFISLFGKPLSAIQIYHNVKKYAKRAGIKRNVFCHALRATCATHLISNKAHPKHVADLLGHVGLNALQSYVQVSGAELREAIAKHHPREIGQV